MSFKGSVDATQLIRNLAKIKGNAVSEFADALKEETLIEVQACKDETPVDTGDLRDGIHMEGPFFEGKKIFTLIATDPAQDDYALIVHEDLEAFHAVGGPKYIERPLAESAPYMPQRIAKRISIERMMK
jgi:hypothetical protein